MFDDNLDFSNVSPFKFCRRTAVENRTVNAIWWSEVALLPGVHLSPIRGTSGHIETRLLAETINFDHLVSQMVSTAI